MEKGFEFSRHLLENKFLSKSQYESLRNPNLAELINQLYNTQVLSETDLVQALNSWGKISVEIHEGSGIEINLDIDIIENLSKFDKLTATPVSIKPNSIVNLSQGGVVEVVASVDSSATLTESTLREALKQEFRSSAWSIEVRYVVETVAMNLINKYSKKFNKSKDVISNMTMSQKVKKIFNDAVKSNTMDVVFLVADNKVKILRKHMSEFFEYDDVKILPEEVNELKNTIVSNLGKVPPKDAESAPNIGFKIDNIVDDALHDGRVDFMLTKYGYQFHVRIVNLKNNDMTYDNYDLTPRTKRVLREALSNTKGLIPISGARGHGKQVFSYATINEYKKVYPNSYIETLEDPVEAKLSGNIAQIEVNEANGYGFAYYLKGLKRHSTNLYFIGELRDRETTEAAINEAVSGALALTTVHASDCAGIPKKLDIELKDAPDILYKVLHEIKLMVNLTMTKAVCPKCKTLVEVENLTKRELKFLNSWSYKGRIYRQNPDGCDSCKSTNAKILGKYESDGTIVKPIVVVEALEINNDVLELLTEDNHVNQKERSLRLYQIGERTYKSQEALRLLNKGIISLEEVMKFFPPNMYYEEER